MLPAKLAVGPLGASPGPAAGSASQSATDPAAALAACSALVLAIAEQAGPATGMPCSGDGALELLPPVP